MNAHNRFKQSHFFIRWLLATSAGYALGFLGGFILGHFLLGNVMVGVGIGLGVGIAQWLILRRKVPKSGWWIAAPTFGLAAALAIYAGVHVCFGVAFDLGWPAGVLGWTVAFAVGGAIAGLIQQKVLRTNAANGSGWIMASMVGWAISCLGLAIPPDMSGGYEGWTIPILILRNGLMAPAIGGLILGAITGIGFLRYAAPTGFSTSTPESLDVENAHARLSVRGRG